MIKISEKLLHFIWKNQLFDSDNLKDDAGNSVEILSAGQHNADSGPDFFDARIKLNDTLWAGNLEIHLKASDWIKHKHHKDKAYDNVILQVVLENDMPIFRTTGEKIPTLVLNVPQNIIRKYQELMQADTEIACQNEIQNIDNFSISVWLNALWVERIKQKSDDIERILKYNKQNWEETFYISLARSYGAKINAGTFENLAKSIPLIILAKHKNNLMQLESLLYGQAGFLDDDCTDDYFLNLQKEYRFLQQKYQLKKMDKHRWKFMRLRPPNFPTVRISQFAALIHKSSHLFSKIIDNENVADVELSFETQASGYWDTHYTFGKISEKRKKNFGKTAIRNVIINTLIPILFLYGKSRDKVELTDKAVQFAETLPPEKNKITRLWEKAGIKTENSFRTQAVIQLYNNYCIKKRCVDCRIGGKILAMKK